jgi:hypothetical protein
MSRGAALADRGAGTDNQKKPPRSPGRIGMWRLLDLVHATMPMRPFGAGAALPEFGPPDEHIANVDPEHELPGSNLAAHEQRGAIAREAARRFTSARGRS